MLLRPRGCSVEEIRIRERDGSGERFSHVIEEDFHWGDVSDVAGWRPREDVSADVVGCVVDDPGAGVAAFCSGVSAVLC